MSGFQEHFVAAIKAAQLSPRTLRKGECQSPASRRCTLCFASSLEYESEIRLKVSALQDFWMQYLPRDLLDPLVTSPRGRAYRTVTKRRAFLSRSGISLGLIDPGEDGHLGAISVVRCAIEPEEHARIYSHVQTFLNEPQARQLAAQLNYVVIKGSYTEYAILLNVREITPEGVKAYNRLSKSLTRAHATIVGLFLFEGQDKSGRIPTHYLQARSPHTQRTFRKIFGEKSLYQKILGRTLAYSPLSFSQVNQSLLGQLIGHADELLALQRHQTLYDLYCGYGPFSLSLAARARRTVGVEMSAESVASAIANAGRLHIHNARFIRSQITSQSLRSIMKDLAQVDAVLLDPPRGGTAEGVIESIAIRRPATILHLFCDMEQLPGEVARWKRGGYTVIRGVPFDMFPGTPEIEMMVLLKPG